LKEPERLLRSNLKKNLTENKKFNNDMILEPSSTKKEVYDRNDEVNP